MVKIQEEIDYKILMKKVKQRRLGSNEIKDVDAALNNLKFEMEMLDQIDDKTQLKFMERNQYDTNTETYQKLNQEFEKYKKEVHKQQRVVEAVRREFREALEKGNEKKD